MDRTCAVGFYCGEVENRPMRLASVAVVDGLPPACGDLVRLVRR